MKKWSFLIIFICILFTFTGCSQINYGISVNVDASITEMVQVKLDEDILSSAEINTLDLLEEIESVMQKWLNEKTQGGIINGFNASIQKESVNFSITLSLNYSNLETYNQFWQITPSEEEIEYEFNFFYDRAILCRKTTIFNNIQNSSFAQHFQSWCEENYPNSVNLWEDSDFQFGYVSALPSSLGYLSNADRTYVVNGMSYYIWEFDLSQSDTEICFYMNIVKGRNLACWWLIFLIMTLLFGICLYLRMFCTTKNKWVIIFRYNKKGKTKH